MLQHQPHNGREVTSEPDRQRIHKLVRRMRSKKLSKLVVSKKPWQDAFCWRGRETQHRCRPALAQL